MTQKGQSVCFTSSSFHTATLQIETVSRSAITNVTQTELNTCTTASKLKAKRPCTWRRNRGQLRLFAYKHIDSDKQWNRQTFCRELPRSRCKRFYIVPPTVDLYNWIQFCKTNWWLRSTRIQRQQLMFNKIRDCQRLTFISSWKVLIHTASNANSKSHSSACEKTSREDEVDFPMRDQVK